MHQSDMAPVIQLCGEPGVHPAGAVAACAISFQCKGNGAIGKAGYEADLYYRWTESGMVVAPFPLPQ